MHWSWRICDGHYVLGDLISNYRMCLISLEFLLVTDFVDFKNLDFFLIL